MREGGALATDPRCLHVMKSRVTRSRAHVCIHQMCMEGWGWDERRRGGGNAHTHESNTRCGGAAQKVAPWRRAWPEAVQGGGGGGEGWSNAVSGGGGDDGGAPRRSGWRLGCWWRLRRSGLGGQLRRGRWHGIGGDERWTHDHAGGGCTRAGRQMAAGSETSAVAGAHVAGPSELVRTHTAARLRAAVPRLHAEAPRLRAASEAFVVKYSVLWHCRFVELL